MTLLQKQQAFAQAAASLIHKASELGYSVTLSEAYRTPEQAAINAKKGSGVLNSLHTMRLAIDINLFKNDQYLTSTADYTPLGEWWEQTYAPLSAWGGRFKRADGNHFSFTHNGVK